MWSGAWFYDEVCDVNAVLSTLKRLRATLGETPILFTFGTKKEDGEKEIDMDAYTALNTAVAESGDAGAIDVEIFSGDDIVTKNIMVIHAAGKVVMDSNHDFYKTPSQADLVYRLRKMQDMEADIPEIAVMPMTSHFESGIVLQNMDIMFAESMICTLAKWVYKATPSTSYVSTAFY